MKHDHRSRGRWSRIERKLDETLRLLYELDERISLMATDQATFDAALVAFLADIDAAVQAIANKVPATVDLSAELAQITDAKSKLDAALNPPAPAPGP